VTPAIALTADAGSEHRARALCAGFQLYVAKPVGILKLVEIAATLNDHGDPGSQSQPSVHR
jgi:CheY-like chemotaxis protein